MFSYTSIDTLIKGLRRNHITCYGHKHSVSQKNVPKVWSIFIRKFYGASAAITPLEVVQLRGFGCEFFQDFHMRRLRVCSKSGAK